VRRALVPILLIGIPIAEIVTAAVVARWMSWPLVIVWFAVALGVGIVVMRRAGTKSVTSLRAAASLNPGEQPTEQEIVAPILSLADAALLFAAGALLAMPGFLSDLLGLFLLIPWGRRVAAGVGAVWAAKRVRRAAAEARTGPRSAGASGAPRGAGPIVISGEVVDRQDDPPTNTPVPPPS
jgi:UPF0716 protein FxsA